MGLNCPLLDRGLSVSEGWPQGGRRARRGEAGRASGPLSSRSAQALRAPPFPQPGAAASGSPLQVRGA